MNWELERQSGVLFMKPTRGSRVREGLQRGALVGGGVGGLSLLFFLASFLGPNPVNWKFQVLSALILGALFGILSAVARFGREDMWIFDTGRKSLVWESRSIGTALKSVTFPLEDLASVRCKERMLEIEWTNGAREALAQAHSLDEAQRLEREIMDYLSLDKEKR